MSTQGSPQVRDTILRIQPYVPGKSADEVRRELGLTDVVKLASNENPLGPSPRAVAELQAVAADAHIYPDGNCTQLKEALAQRLHLSPQHLMVGNGSDEIIKLLAEAYLAPGEEVVFAQPTFGEYAYATRLMGGEEVAVPLQDMTYDLSALLQKIGPRTKIVFICNPNNPTGTTVTRRAMDEFMEAVPPHVIVVLDEAYREYVETSDFPDGLRYIQAGHHVLILRTFSKIYGLAGLRVGYGIGPPELIAQIQRVKEPFNVNSFAQRAALAALEDTEHVARSRAANAAGKARFYVALGGLGLPYVRTEANFVFLDTKRDSQAVFAALLRQGIIVRTGDVFGYPTYLRVTVGLPEQNRRFFTALEQVLAEIPRLDPADSALKEETSS